MYSRTFDSHNPWQAAYLLVMGVPFIGTRRTADGKYINFTFENESDRAWDLSLTWRNGGDTTVDALAFMKAYKQMSLALRTALNEGTHRDDENTNN